jgi:GST-like protein
VSAVYPTFTYGDVTERWVNAGKDKGAGKTLRQATDTHRQDLLRFLERQVKAPFFLGRQPSALDVYVWVLAKWRPGEIWLAEHCPKLCAIAKKMDQHPVCARVAARNRF